MLIVATTYAAMAWTLGRLNVGVTLTALGAYVFAFGLPRLTQIGHQQLLPQMFAPPAIWLTWRFFQAPTVTALAGESGDDLSANPLVDLSGLVLAARLGDLRRRTDGHPTRNNESRRGVSPATLADRDRIGLAPGLRCSQRFCNVCRGESRISSAIFGGLRTNAATSDLVGDGCRMVSGSVCCRKPVARRIPNCGYFPETCRSGYSGSDLRSAIGRRKNSGSDGDRLPRDSRAARASGSASGRLFALACDLEMGARRTSDPSRGTDLDRSRVVCPVRIPPGHLAGAQWSAHLLVSPGRARLSDDRASTVASGASEFRCRALERRRRKYRLANAAGTAVSGSPCAGVGGAIRANWRRCGRV